MFAYTVRCEFDDPAVADQWIAWMKTEHLAEVRAAGARRAEVIRFDGSPACCEARYLFDSRPSFEAYERDHAPRLRARGRERFPPGPGLRYTRSTGEVVATA
jgi:hypothetical protein